MKAIWTGAIGFGLVNIPIKMYSATQDSSLDFDMLDKKDLSNIKFQRVNERTGKVVEWDNIVKGYMHNDKYVVMTDKDFEAAASKQSKVIEIMDFVDEKQIDTLYYESPYYLEPEKNGSRAYGLLRDALVKTKKVGIGTFVLRSKESLVLIKPHGDILVLNKLRFGEEVRETTEINVPEKTAAKSKELEMAVSLINQLSGDFKIDRYHDSYTERLLKLIESKAKGVKALIPKMKILKSSTDDLMAQLKASLTPKKKAS